MSRKRVRNKPKRLRIFRNSGGKCYWCGGTITYDEMTVDHLIPSSQEGTNEEKNLVASHKHCNEKRGNEPLEISLKKRKLQHASRILKELDRSIGSHKSISEYESN